MRMLPLRLASLAIIGFPAITCFDIATGLEHWPFGSYPMYSLRYAERLSWLRLYGLTDRGEIPLRDERDFAPFDEARLIVALQRLPVGAPLRALRLYAVSWDLRPGLQGSEPPTERILIAQATAAEAER